MQGPPGDALGDVSDLAGLPCTTGSAAGTVKVNVSDVNSGSAITFKCDTGAQSLQVQVANTTRYEHYSCGVFQTCTRTLVTSGSVSINPPGVACGVAGSYTTCSRTYLPDTEVTLTASGTSTGFFDGWGGACQGVTTNTCTVTLDQARYVYAYYRV